MSGTVFADPVTRVIGEWAAELTPAGILLRYALAFFCAAVIGCERAHNRHSAGLRTFLLVILGGTTAMIADQFMIREGSVRAPVLSGACLIGIAYISANSFFQSSRNQIKGLTTAAALWLSAFIGIAAGGGYYTAGLVCFMAFMIVLSMLPSMEHFLIDRSNHFEVHLELKSRDSLKDFVTTIRRIGLKIDDIEANPAYTGSGLSVYSVSFTITREELKKYKRHSQIVEALRTLDYVFYIEEM